MRKYNILLFFLFGGTPDKISFLPNLSISLSFSSFLYVKHLKQQLEANKTKVKIHQPPITRTYLDGCSRFRSTLAFSEKIPAFLAFSFPNAVRVSEDTTCLKQGALRFCNWTPLMHLNLVCRT